MGQVKNVNKNKEILYIIYIAFFLFLFLILLLTPYLTPLSLMCFSLYQGKSKKARQAIDFKGVKKNSSEKAKKAIG